MVELFTNEKDFLISNFDKLDVINKRMCKEWKQYDNITHLFGYVFLGNNHKQYEELSQKDFGWLKSNNIDASGVFCALNYHKDKLEICIDPLCQFNIFYYIVDNHFTISSSIEMIRDLHNLQEVDDDFLFDQIAYRSMMRSKTILKNVGFLQFDDLYYQEKKEINHLLQNMNIEFVMPDYHKYDHLGYESLLKLYNQRLANRAKTLIEKFDEIELQLTGGADSRLALSAFLDVGKEKLRCYVYGDGHSQNRLIFEELLNALDVKPVEKVRTSGRNPVNSAMWFKTLGGVNYLKLNNSSLCMNGTINSDSTICKITGYYGANVSGGVGFPPKNTVDNDRTRNIPSSLFTYHNYVSDFRSKHKGLRAAALNDRFYINNRGKSHYAAHSIVDNKYISSVDILYDFINLLLVEKCPYEDMDINRCAISIDLIYLKHPQLAMFPYDDRKIPKYRWFENIPLINCFDSYTFKYRELERLPMELPNVDASSTDYLQAKDKIERVSMLFEHDLIKSELKKYPELAYLTKQYDIESSTFLFFLLGKLRMTVLDASMIIDRP